MKKTILKLWILALPMMLGLTSCSDDDNAAGNDERKTQVDQSENWKQRNDKTFMAGIGDKPLAFQQSLSRTFPNTVQSLGEAEIAIMDMDWAMAHMWDVEEFYQRNGLLLLLPPKDQDFPKLGYESFNGWDELVWATHVQYDDMFYLLDEPAEYTGHNEDGTERKVVVDKNQDYYNTRLTALVDWIDAFESDRQNGPTSARAMTRAQANEKPDLETIVMDISKDFTTYSVNFPYSLDWPINKVWEDVDRLRGSSSVTLTFDVMPIYMSSVNGSKAGDYYAVRSRVTPHNRSMWDPYEQRHGSSGTTVYGYWFKCLDYKFNLIDPDTRQVAYGTRFQELPYPENSFSARNHTNEFSFGINGSLSAGVSSATKVAGNLGGSLSFSAQWKESISYTVQNIDYERITTTSEVQYRWYSNDANIKLKDNWDNYNENFPEDIYKEFTAENVWVWHVPYGKAGVEDDSQKQFWLNLAICPQYSSWYRTWGTVGYDMNRKDYYVDLWKPEKEHIMGEVADDGGTPWIWGYFSFKLPLPDRSKWGLFSLRNDSPNYLMRNVMVYKKGEEDKEPVAKFDRKTYLHNESAEAGLPVGTYSATYELVQPNNGAIYGRGIIRDITVAMSKTKDNAPGIISTGMAEFTKTE